MVQRRYKQKSEYALSKKLRRRFYKAAAIATVIYVMLSLTKFYGQYDFLSYDLAIIWAVFLICYTSFKEIIRWNHVSDNEYYNGELWAALVIAGLFWMIIWNAGRALIFHLPRLPVPEDYIAAAIETLVLYTLSTTSSYLYKNKGRIGMEVEERIQEGERLIEPKRTAPKIKIAVAKQTYARGNQKTKIILAKSPPPRGKKSKNLEEA